MGCFSILRGTSSRVHLLMILFGMRAWIDVSGIWVQLPILVQRLPEDWALGSYFSVLAQLANVVLLVYTLANTFAPKIFTVTRCITVVYLTGFALVLSFAFLWKTTHIIDGTEHSIVAMALAFVMGGLDCTTSVLFIQFVAKYKTPYITSMYIGNGLAQLLPSVVSLIQGAGNTICQNSSLVYSNHSLVEYDGAENVLEPVLQPPLFSAKYFFIVVFMLEVISGIGFLTLCLSPVCKREHVQDYGNTFSPGNDLSNQEMNDCQEEFTSRIKKNTSYSTLTYLSRKEFASLLFLAGWINALWSGVILSFQSYAVLPHGILIYHISVTLGEVASPIACFISLFFPTKSLTRLSLVVGVATGVGAYVIVMACLSPTPPLVDMTIGKALIVSAQVIVVGVYNYIKVNGASICHRESRRATKWFGVSLQLGGFIGSVLSFLLVNVFRLLHSAKICSY